MTRPTNRPDANLDIDAEAAESLASAFRDAMRRIASSVTLVTTRDAAGRPHGMAASAVIPVSLDPPSLLIAVNRHAGLHPTLSVEGRFCVNLLADAHQALLADFSRSDRRAERFLAGQWETDSDALPRLASAPAAVSCQVEQRIDYGSHSLFIGRVTAVQVAGQPARPLIWFDGAGASLASPPPAACPTNAACSTRAASQISAAGPIDRAWVDPGTAR